MGQSTLLRARGLHTLKNYLSELPQGALLVADNSVINRDSIIESRRGFALYGNSFGIDSDRVKQLLAYKGRILRHYSDVLQFDSDGAGTFSSFAGSYSEVESGLRIKGVEGNGNFLFTTTAGIKKISVSSASQLSTAAITDAGAPKALDIRGTANTGTPGFLSVSSKVAYRVVWGYKDANNLLIIGAPSPRVVVENTSAINTAVVDLEVVIPEGVTTAFFYQIYRSAIVPNTQEPDDELYLVLEDNPTSTDITNGYLNTTDITPDDFRAGGTLLYTNPISGDGINQANNPPPLAKDITLFKNTMFYANTKTRHQLTLNLLSVSTFTAGSSTITISDGSVSEIYTFDVAENVGTQTALLSASPSVSIAIDETARSLCYVINRQATGTFYAFYLSGANDVPGQILIERRDQSDTPFYVATNDAAIDDKWNPVLPVELTITGITTGATPTVTTSAPHGLATGDTVVLYGTDSTPDIDGIRTITVTGASTFTVVASPPVTVAGTAGTAFLTSVASDNEESANRLYFSKFQQHEAVPIVNYLDIGPKDQPIIRIIALRDSLFVLKTDGVYRVTGDTSANFSSFLFDGSTRIFAPDSGVVLNNQIYAFTTQGVASISDTGVSIVSRDIENLIIPTTAPQYTNNAAASFAVTYESDRAYVLWLVTETDDTVATQALRYNTFTNTWTRWPISKTCGIVNFAGDDKIYLGAADTNYVEKERKEFSRYDYADRDILETIPPNSINGNIISVGSVADFKVGDVLLQTQYVTISQFNRLLLKLDNDPLLSGGFYSSFALSPGDNLSTAMTNLVAELNIQDTSTTYVFSGTTVPATIQAEYNVIIGQLNVSTGVHFTNYAQSTGTISYDAIVTAVDRVNINVTMNYVMPFLQGDILLYKSIPMQIVWAPAYLSDPSMFKQVREGTILFETSSFYGAAIAYSSDLSKNFESISFNANGNGQFGAFVFGNHTFGGEGTQIPMRTYIPRDKQRCRWLNVKFTHEYALENPAIYGVSFVHEDFSTRAYR